MRQLISFVTAGASALLVLNTARGDVIVLPNDTVARYSQFVENNSGVKATDLELTYSAGLNSLRADKINGTGKASSDAVNGTGLKQWKFDFGASGPNNGTEVKLIWSAKGDPPKIASGQWTQNGNGVKNISENDKNIIGKPAKVAFSFDTNTNQYLASAEFTNDQAVALSYTNVRFFVDNAALGYSGDDFDTPTGTQVGATQSFTLPPTDTMTFQLGAVNPDNYELALATIAESSDPSTAFDTSAANLLPEPAGVVSAIGALAVGICRRRRG